MRNPLDVVHYFVTLPERLDAYEAKLNKLLADDSLHAHSAVQLSATRTAVEDKAAGLAEATLDLALIWQAREDADVTGGGHAVAVGTTPGTWLGGEGQRLWGVQLARALLQSRMVE